MKKLSGIFVVLLLSIAVVSCNHEAKHVHVWDDGIVTTPASCTTTGIKTYTCSGCGETKTETIPESHNLDSSYVCTLCGKVKDFTVTEFISALGTEVTTITADSDKKGITVSEDGKTVNIYNVSIVSGEFQETYDHIPSTVITANLIGLDISSLTSLQCMFCNCFDLTELNISNFDTSNVTNISFMFNDCWSLKSLDLSSFDTSNVTDMAYMFNWCKSITSLDLSNFDTAKVTKMGGLFSNCSALTSLDLSNFDTSNVTDMAFMFNECSALKSLNLSSFKTSNVTSMQGMFCNCNFKSLDLSNFNTSKVKSMNHMFGSCKSLKTLDLSSFDTSKIDLSTYGVDFTFFGCGTESYPLTVYYSSKWTLDTSSTYGGAKALTWILKQ